MSRTYSSAKSSPKLPFPSKSSSNHKKNVRWIKIANKNDEWKITFSYFHFPYHILHPSYNLTKFSKFLSLSAKKKIISNVLLYSSFSRHSLNKLSSNRNRLHLFLQKTQNPFILRLIFIIKKNNVPCIQARKKNRKNEIKVHWVHSSLGNCLSCKSKGGKKLRRIKGCSQIKISITRKWFSCFRVFDHDDFAVNQKTSIIERWFQKFGNSEWKWSKLIIGNFLFFDVRVRGNLSAIFLMRLLVKIQNGQNFTKKWPIR